MNVSPLPIIVLLLTLNGCASQAPLPDDSYFRLDAATPASRVFAKPPINGLLMVEELQANALRGERALLYSEDPGHRQLQRDHYHYWVDPPPRLIQNHLVQRLRAVGLARLVLRYDIDIGADTIVSGRVERFEQLIDGEHARVIVALELQLRHPGETQPRLAANYTEEVSVTDASPDAAITGFEQALNRIIDRFVGDIIENNRPSHGR